MSDTTSADTRQPPSPEKYPGPLVVLVRLQARTGKADAAQQALEKITDPTRANPDCVEFRVLQDKDDPHSFTLLEHWVSLEANAAHGKCDYMAEYMATKNDIFEDIDGQFVQEIRPPH
jgi:quinol monooxygenase YgiN